MNLVWGFLILKAFALNMMRPFTVAITIFIPTSNILFSYVVFLPTEHIDLKKDQFFVGVNFQILIDLCFKVITQ